MTITGLYIVKNGEADIVRSIRSIRGACDEVVVIDTGSTDKTVELVSALGAKVFYFEWVDNFAMARNFALSKANGDLVIFLDSDEWFYEPLGSDDRRYLLGLIEQDYLVFSVLRNDIVNGVALSPVYGVRMLRGKLGLHYNGAIHEYITDTERTFYLPERFLLGHSGYDGELNLRKVERNLVMLTRQYESEKDPFARLNCSFYLARENEICGNIYEAFRWLVTFFEIWNNTDNSEQPHNIGINAYDMAAKLYADAEAATVSNHRYFALCCDFLRDAPQHPATFLALANYYYSRHRDLENALDAISRLETAAVKYRIEDYPHDIIGEKEPLANALMMKGDIMFELRRREEALACYMSAQKHSALTQERLRRLINLISGRSTKETVAFLSALAPEVTLEYIEMLLSQLLYFPGMREVYAHFAALHMKISDKQSDISAVAAMLSGGDVISVVQYANTIAEADTVTAGVLHLLAVLASGSEAVFDAMAAWPSKVWLFESLRTGVKQNEFSGAELAILHRAFPVVVFLGDNGIKERFFDIISGFDLMRTHMILTYCNRSEEYGELLPLIDIDCEQLDLESRAKFLTLMGRAYRTVGDYQNAERNLSASLTLNPGSVETYLELGILASAAPQLAHGIHAFTQGFREAHCERCGDESIDAIIQRLLTKETP